MFTLQLIAAVGQTTCSNTQLTLMSLDMVARSRQPLPPMMMARSLEARSPHLEAAAVLSSRSARSSCQRLKYLWGIHLLDFVQSV